MPGAALNAPPAPPAWLVPLAGPPLNPVQLPVKPGGVTLGRHEACDVRLPADADKVSRQHARLSWHGGAWRLADLRSRWGTFLNGVKVEPGGPEMLLSEGDFIRITPWTFSFSMTGPAPRGLRTADDGEQFQTMVHTVAAEAQPLAEEMLTLLLESAAAVHSATDERALAELVLDAATRGTGMPNAALLRPLDAAGTVEVVAARRGARDERSEIFSRSLLAAASAGAVAELSGNRDVENISSSIVQMKIETALCVPLMLGQTVAAYLYLDSRSGGNSQRRLRPNAAAFCTALGRMASLALSNLKRIDIERRQVWIESELSAAAAAQRWILPKRQSTLAGFTVIGESRPGAYVGGDFFDLIVLSETKLAVALGDVTGHGIAASVLMTAAQGFLHAALQEHADAARAVTDLNRFVNPRRSDDKFITAWVGVFNSDSRTISYVDAGHGYALMLNPDGTTATLAEGEGLPIGLFADAEYTSVTRPLDPGGRALVISDGLVEQYGLVHQTGGTTTNEQFHVSGIQRIIAAVPRDADPVTALFDAVIKHAATSTLQDDATAVLVTW
ncbi:MAG TPA: SpoIIE family protein phosphatase [Tepidisphaeraceae bacterium]|nr:SpoIIE family protein phosphatase [Tepidisphaeraceae bacterium]